MKNRMILIASVATVAIVSLLLSCKGSTEPPENSWTYVGTWVNSAYNGHGGQPPAKMVMTTNSIQQYDNDTDPTPTLSGSFTLVDDWTSGGEHYFKGPIDFGTFTVYSLLRVGNNNSTMEGDSSPTGYPAAINATDAGYGIFARQ
jgi:hypothetical protein